MPIPIFNLPADTAAVQTLLDDLTLNAADLALERGRLGKPAAAVKAILQDVAERGDAAIVDAARKFDDPDFTVEQLRVSRDEMAAASDRVPAELRSALQRSIAQVREYQTHVMPKPIETLERPGVDLGMQFTPIDSAGLYFPGGKAAYPSSLIMLAVPAQVAGVEKIVVCTPPSKYGKSDLVLAACHELGLEFVFRAGGAAAIAAMAFGTSTIPAVDKIVGPGNTYVQLAKRMVSGGVGVDGFLGPSEILILADGSGHPAFIASDLIAQAEHDPGSCFLLTTSASLADEVRKEIEEQAEQLNRREAIDLAMSKHSAIVVSDSMATLIEWANRFAAEHVNLQVNDEEAVLGQLKHAGAVFLGRYSPVAAGDYVAGPSHCLPTNTTARFSSGISVYEFLKRSSFVRYSLRGIIDDAPAIRAIAIAEHLDGHAASVARRAAHARFIDDIPFTKVEPRDDAS